MNIAKSVVACALIGSASIAAAGVAVPSPKASATFNKINIIQSNSEGLYISGDGSTGGSTGDTASAQIRGVSDAILDRCLKMALYAQATSAVFNYLQRADSTISCSVSQYR